MYSVGLFKKLCKEYGKSLVNQVQKLWRMFINHGFELFICTPGLDIYQNFTHRYAHTFISFNILSLPFINILHRPYKNNYIN